MIFFGLPWLLRERKEDFGNISDAERFFTTMMISFFWFLGMILRVKFCCDELEELESEEQTEIEKKISQKEEIEIEK